MSIKQLAVVGAGTMGRSIAYLFAMHQIQVVLYNRKEETLKSAATYIAEDLKRRESKGKITQQEAEQIQSKIQYTTRMETLANSDIVIESIAEDESLKADILAAIEQNVSTDCIIATNTSSLSLNKLSAALKHKVRFIGLHFFNPAHIMKLVEIIPSFFSSPATTQACQALLDQVDKRSVICQATPGFIVNRMARPFYLEGFRLLEEGVATAQQIDKALKAGGQFRMGPLELTDFIGQDVNYEVSRQIWKAMQFDARYTPGHLQLSLVDAGLLGRKNGHSYFQSASDEERSDSLAAKAFTAPVSIQISGQHAFADYLKTMLTTRSDAIRIEHTEAQGPALICVNESFVISVTDGRTAESLARVHGMDTFVIDWALDYSVSDYLVAAHNKGVRAEHRELFLMLMQYLFPKVVLIKDSPALIVARVLCSLIHESILMTESGICTRQDIELASVDGVNYAKGIFTWLQWLGEGPVIQTLSQMAALLNTSRYTPHYSYLHFAPLSAAMAS
ncbi:3-hydroxyacyl-CoA dehydrogenase NAD-binding domain-containing protein [Photobacterium sp. SP02]|uniref:3-hydroxyacyl-CoA dehydrogenase NAD-binding domain-containing protein n=1 Tax=Photobacterium sp. SP02 TaxID=3032280 RepID=UPI00314508EB